MDYLIDTGILLRLFDNSDLLCPAIRQSLRHLRRKGHRFFVTQQNIAEFWNVSTRPQSSRGGFGQSISVTARRIAFIEGITRILTESEQSFTVWKNLVFEHGIRGSSVHDARLVAVMKATGIPTIVTLDLDDFFRFTEITAKGPTELLALPASE